KLQLKTRLEVQALALLLHRPSEGLAVTRERLLIQRHPLQPPLRGEQPNHLRQGCYYHLWPASLR
ncbi:MAG: hypothetical protein AAB048_04350, partial [Planctomycetota bacterium]